MERDNKAEAVCALLELGRTIMPVTLDRILIWGRPLDEYVDMFALSDEDLEERFLDCASGPASFNASLTMLGGSIISLDPIYCLSSDEITGRINEAYNMIIGQLKEAMTRNYSMVNTIIPSRIIARFI